MAVDSGSYTPDVIARRKALAEALYNKKRAPMTHWAQGVEQLGDVLVGGMLEGKNKKDRSEANEFLASQLMGSPAQAAPAAPAAMPQGAPVSTAPTNGKVYANDEPSPLDPPSGNDRDMAIRTVLAEAGNQNPQGMQAIASVLRNRATAGNFGGDTLPGVIQKPMQFEPWNTEGGRQKMAAIDPNSPQYQQAGQALEQAYAGQDPTMGATHFYAPKAQAALGRPAPKWDNGTGVDIKDHRFFGGAGTPQVTAGASPTDVSAQARPGMQPTPAAPQAQQAPDQQKALIAEMLRSKNPYVQQQGQTLAAALLQKQFATPSYDFKVAGDTLYRTNPKTGQAEKAGEASKKSWGKIGTDPNTGQDVMGVIDLSKDSPVSPNAVPARGDNGVVPAPPPGVDPKIWHQEQSKRKTEEGMPASMDDTLKVRGRVEGLPSYKNVASAAPVYKSMMNAAGRDNRAADVNMIYGMAKLMDPGSVVRESEMTVAQAVATLPEQLKAAVWSQLEGKGRLTPEVREAIMQEAHSRMVGYKEMFDMEAGQYRGFAERNRMRPEDVIPEFGQFAPYQRPAAPPSAPAQGAPPQPAGAPDRSAIEAEMKRRGLLK